MSDTPKPRSTVLSRKIEPNLNKTRGAEARRGAHNARAFLSTNPTQADMRAIWPFLMWEEGSDEPDPISLAYDRAFRAVLLPYMRSEPSDRPPPQP